jgi:diguanylate cyclase (GGDEF)-like protein/PAS domain S-box-containing protein
MITTRAPSPADGRRLLHHLGAGLLAALLAAVVVGTSHGFDGHVHGVLEAVGITLSLVVALVALIRYQAQSSASFLLVGLAFLGAALLDGLHVGLSAAAFAGWRDLDPAIVVPASELPGRLYLAAMLIGSWIGWRLESRPEGARRVTPAAAVVAALPVLAASLLAGLAAAQLMPAPGVLPPAFQAAPLALTLAALTAYLHKGAWRTYPGEHLLVMALVVATVGQAALMLPFGPGLGAGHLAGHVVKVVFIATVVAAVMASLGHVLRETERQAEAVRESEARAVRAETLLRDAIESMPQGSVIWGPDDRLILFNRESAALYPICGARLQPGIRIEDFCRIAAYSGEIVDAVGREEAWIAERLAARRAHAGRPFERRLTGGRILEMCDMPTAEGGLVTVQTDVTDARRREQALRESEERYRRLVDASPDGILVHQDGRYVLANPKAAELLGVERPESLVGQDVLGFFTDEHRDLARERVARLVEHGAMSDWMEWTRRRADGSVIEVESCGVAIQHRGRPAGLVVLRDIAERRRAQEALERQRFALGERVKELRCLYEVLHLCNEPERGLESICREAVERLVVAMQVPPLTVARIVVGGIDCRSEGWAETPWSLSAELVIDGRAEGAVTVAYLPGADGDPPAFLPEEHDLVAMVARELANAIARRRAVEGLRASEAALARSQRIARLGTFRRELPSNRITLSAEMFRLWGLEEAGEAPPREQLIAAVHEADRQAFEETIADGIARKGTYQHEFRAVLPDGRIRHLWTEGHCELDEQGLVRAVFGVCQDVTDRVEAERQIRHMAQHDGLTGLPNRLLFGDRLAQALAAARRSGDGVAVLCLDLNDFKSVNDSLGHAAGDELLRRVAERLGELVRDSDTVARLGGDEFAVIQTGIQGLTGAAVLARRMVERLSEPVTVDGQELWTSACVGIALFPDDGHDPTTLLRHADMALYRAKAFGRGAFQFFLPEMNEELRLRRDLERDLRQALDEGHFALAFQPQLDLWQERIVGIEALLRWPHPGRGLVPPDLFIPVAEESGLIMTLGEWALHAACAQARAWLDAGLAPMRVAVNLSPIQFRHQDLLDVVTRALEETGLPARLLELEITEGALMHDTESATATLAGLHALGVGIAVDDFGTGYSSLGYLKRFPIDKIKIDRSFIFDIPADRDDAAIARAVITLGHSLGLKVIAEGVETAAQLAFLKREGCDEAQGYFFAAPLSAAACTDLLARGGPARHRAAAASIATISDHSPFQAAIERPRKVNAT